MKSFCFWILFFFVAVFSGYGQNIYVKSLDVSFSGGNNGGFGGGCCFTGVYYTILADGWLEVQPTNNKEMFWYMGNCYTKNIVFDQTNRYIEFRLKSDTARLSPMLVNTYGGCNGCCTEVKTWPGNTFIIPEADKWTVVLLKIPPTTGCSQNIVDTVSNGLAIFLKTGKYVFDYYKVGIAAIPPKPAIDVVNNQIVFPNDTNYITLTGIAIPGRITEGLIIKVETKHGDSIIRDLHFRDLLGAGPVMVDEGTNIAIASLQFTTDSGALGLSDSVFITLTDTVRNTTTIRVFKVSVVENTISLASSSTEIIVYPNPTISLVTIELPETFTGEINIADLVGNVILSQKITGTTAKIDLSAAAPGMYIIRISDGKEVVYRKILKE